jgi:O-antigen/teichoic acid export membrane protein
MADEAMAREPVSVKAPVRNPLARFVRHGAIGAMAAQVSQAGGSFALQLIAAVMLGLAGFGKFAILYGVIVLLTGLASGFVGDSLTVLNRRSPGIRAGLQGWAILLSVGAGLVGFATPAEGALFAVAIMLFLLEDVFRRLLMAELLFWRITIVDAVAVAVSLTTLGITAAISAVTLSALFGALALGQGFAIVVAIILVPARERYLVPVRGGEFATVFGYGAWRSAQQGVRPALLTAVRTAVVIVIGLTAVGELEAARLFVAPAMLLVSGFSSFLFASFARSNHLPLTKLLRKADIGVAQLVGVTILIGAAALLVLPEVGQHLIGERLNSLTVVGWLAYAASVAAVTPYGALAAVRGKQATVLALRVTDSVLSLTGAILLVLLGGPVSLVPFVLTLGSLLGGLAIRWLVLSPQLSQSSLSPTGAISFPKKKAASHV